MKKALVGAGVGMACGVGLAAYLLTNKRTKRNADRLLNNMMNEANEMINKMN